MSSVAQDGLVVSNTTAIDLTSDAAEGNRRGQGWIIVLGASAVLWAGIIVAVVGIVDLLN